jgi:hypothetical protein
MIDFSTLKGMTIPEGEVVKIAVGDTVLWQSQETPSTPGYTNLADPTSADWAVSSRFASGGKVSATSGLTADITNYIPITEGSVVRVKGMNITSALSTNAVCRICFYNSAKTYIGMLTTSSTHKSMVTVENGISSITIDETLKTTMGLAYYPALVRFNGTLTGTKEDVIITVNEEIV